MDIVRRANTLSQIIVQFYSKNKLNFVRAGKAASISFAVAISIQKIYEAYFGALRDIPGPFIAKFFELPSLIYDIPVGTLFKKIKKMHDKYGSVVRIGPASISISDKDMIRQVLLLEDLPKGPRYSLFKKVRETLFSTRSKTFHKQRRKIVSPAFSVKYLNSLEPFMTSVATSLVDQIDKEIELTKDQEGYGTVNIWHLMQCLALDVIGETAFGQTFHMVENGKHMVPTIIKVRMKVIAYVLSYPSIAKLFITGESDPRLVKFVQDIIDQRIKSGQQRNDILQYLINTQQAESPEDRLNAEAIIQETTLFLIAGSETTSNSLSFVIIELLRHPDKLAKLYQEIDQVPAIGVTFHHEDLKRLSYLNAVINETLRMDPVVADGLQRSTTQDISLANQLMLPKDISILCNLYHAQLNENYWPQASQFIPERWIPGEAEYDESNDFNAYFPFSSGSRNCIGKNFALQEMRIALATFLRNFEIAPIEKEMDDSKNIRQFLTMSVAKSSFNVRIKRR